MGRKPNKLLEEFFVRGQKLDDASNRYQQTCRNCGEKIAKGRIDSLVAHILKKCPAISTQDRQRALQVLSETPNQNGTYHHLAVAMRREQQQNEGQSGDIAVGQQNHNLSPLETLAEVSRQRLDSNGQYVPATGNSKKRKRGGGRKDATRQQAAAEELVPKDENAAANNETDSEDPTAALLRRGLDQFSAEHNLQRDIPYVSAAPTARMVPDQLALAASAANEMIPGSGTIADNDTGLSNVRAMDRVNTGRALRNAAALANSPAIDPQLQDEDTRAQMPSPAPNGEPFERAKAFIPAPSQMQNVISSSMPHAGYLNDFSITTGDRTKIRARGRFSDSRRKEVQEVRKQGACVRCRMLKKPCSGGTPCTTCKSVESARLWKAPCVRARIGDEFDLYATGLHPVLAFNDVNQTKGFMELEKSPNLIVATHFPGSDIIPAMFPSVRGQTPVPSFAYSYENFPTQTTVEIELLDQESDENMDRLFHYVKRCEHVFFEQESSTFMRSTLILAAELVSQKLDPLLSRALELWTLTTVLIDSAGPWRLFLSPNQQQETTSEIDLTREVSVDTFPINYRLLTEELRSQTEKRAASVAKVLMNDLERRLLQRQQTADQHFETFLTAVIFLNCVERMSWLFSAWAVRISEHRQMQVSKDQPARDLPDKGGWPLEKLPEEFVTKGERIADVVTMLVRMRGIPPATQVGEDRILRVATDGTGDASPGEGNAQSSEKKQVDMARVWLEGLQLDVDAMKQVQVSRQWDATNCRCWDMRYVSQLLLSEKEK